MSVYRRMMDIAKANLADKPGSKGRSYNDGTNRIENHTEADMEAFFIDSEQSEWDLEFERYAKSNGKEHISDLALSKEIRDALETLELAPEELRTKAGREEKLLLIRTAYRRSAKQHHSDRGGQSGKMEEVNSSYTILKEYISK